jgi:hypothetical protein
MPQRKKNPLLINIFGCWDSIPSRGNGFSLCFCIQTASGIHSASYPMGTRGKVARGWRWSTLLHPVFNLGMHRVNLHPLTCLLGAIHKHRNNFVYTFFIQKQIQFFLKFLHKNLDMHHIQGFDLGSTKCCMWEYARHSCRLGNTAHTIYSFCYAFLSCK